jgi:hypothetical protein
MLQFALHPFGPLYHFGTTFFILQFCPSKIKSYLGIQYNTFC